VFDNRDFIRGNVSVDRADHILSLQDVVDLAAFLFANDNFTFNCDAASDTNNDGIRNITDLVTSVHGIFSTVIMAPPNFLNPGIGIPGVVVPDGGTIPSILGCAEGETTACPSVQVIDGFTFQSGNTQGFYEYTHDWTGIEFVLLPGGEFEMGSPEGEGGRSTNEGQVHTVTLSPFLIAKYEVTQAQYASVMDGSTVGLGPTPSVNSGTAAASDQRPVEQVSFNDLQDADGFLARTDLSLPSEAQWEYACRAGQAGPFSGTGVLDDMGWQDQNSGGSHHPVGTKQANQFGLFDMHGNVYEWCEDFYNANFYNTDAATELDPEATSGSGLRVIRGGRFDRNAALCRSARRAGNGPALRDGSGGFRPARPLP
jgi:formylglycine-generating enzyme required for sulfatase activity